MAPTTTTTFSFSEEESIATYLNMRCWHFACWVLPLLAMDLWRLLLSLALALAAGLHGVSWVAVVGIEALLEECAETKGLVRRKISGAGWEWEWEWVERERERAERVKDMAERVKEMEREIRESAQRERMQREREERERGEREREERERKEREDQERVDRARADREREERERNLREQQERERNYIEDNPHQHSDLDLDSDIESDTPSDTDSDTSDPDSDTPSSSSSSSPKAEPTKDTPSANSPPLQTQVSITASGNTPFNFTFKSEEKGAEPVIRTGGSRWLPSEEEYLLLLCKESRNWAQISEMVNARFARCRTQGACSSKFYKLRNGGSTS